MEEKKLSKLLQKLCGREEDLNALNSVFEKARIRNSNVEAVFIAGPPGCGKSALVEQAFKNKECLLGSGKYAQRRNSQPLSVFACVMTQIFDAIGSTNLEKYSNLLEDELSYDDKRTLNQIIPKYSDYMCAPTTGLNEKLDLNSIEGLQQIKNSLRCFFRTIALEDCPIVIHVDDLQWAGDTTLDLFEFILLDSQIKQLVFIGCYRDDEILNNQTALKWIERISSSLNQTTKLSIVTLSSDAINHLLSDILKLDRKETKDLATLMEKRTNGDVFYILQLLDHLQAEGLLYRDIMTSRFKWDIFKVQEQTMLSENVVELVTANIRRLPTIAREVTKLASCLGFRFNETNLILIKGIIQSEVEIEDLEIQDCIRILIKENLMERCENGDLEFSHNKIYQASLELIPDATEREKMHIKIGITIVMEHQKNINIDDTSFDATGLDDSILFLCANQLSLGITLMNNHNHRIKFVKLSLEASKRAAGLSSFHPAIRYLKEGIATLKNSSTDPWKNYYRLSLEMHSLLAEMYFAVGELDLIQYVENEVFLNTINVEGGIRVYLVKIRTLNTQSEYDMVLKISAEALGKLGENIPVHPGKIQQILAFQNAKQKARKFTIETVVSLPKMTNGRKIAVMKIFWSLWDAAFQTGNHKLISVLTCRAIDLTLIYGLAPFSAVAFSLMAMQVAHHSLQDLDMTFQLHKIGKAIANKINDDAARSLVTVVSAMITHFQKPMCLAVDESFGGYEIGMKVRDRELAFRNITAYFALYFYSGLPLNPIVGDLKKFLEQMSDYGQQNFVLMNLPIYQCVLGITETFDESSTFRSNVASEKIKSDGKTSKLSYSMQMAYYCGDMKLAREISKKLQTTSVGDLVITFFYQTRVFFFALIDIWYAKKTKKQKYKRSAIKHINTFRRWVKNRMINCGHKLQILESELKSMNSRFSNDLLMKDYSQAISASAKAGFLQDAAVINYLAGSHFLTRDYDIASRYIQQAHKMYLLWGAKKVAKSLEKDFPELFKTENDNSNTKQGSLGFRSRQRFDGSLVTQHKMLPRHLRSIPARVFTRRSQYFHRE